MRMTVVVAVNVCAGIPEPHSLAEHVAGMSWEFVVGASVSALRAVVGVLIGPVVDTIALAQNQKMKRKNPRNVVRMANVVDLHVRAGRQEHICMVGNAAER